MALDAGGIDEWPRRESKLFSGEGGAEEKSKDCQNVKKLFHYMFLLCSSEREQAVGRVNCSLTLAATFRCFAKSVRAIRFILGVRSSLVLRSSHRG